MNMKLAIVLEDEDLELVANVLGEVVEAAPVDGWPNPATVERLRVVVKEMDDAVAGVLPAY